MACDTIKVTFTNAVTNQSTEVSLPSNARIGDAEVMKFIRDTANAVVVNPGSDPQRATNGTALQDGARVTSTPNKVAGATLA